MEERTLAGLESIPWKQSHFPDHVPYNAKGTRVCSVLFYVCEMRCWTLCVTVLSPVSHKMNWRHLIDFLLPKMHLLNNFGEFLHLHIHFSCD